MSPLYTVDEVKILTRGKPLVFTNGVFDILHAGHTQYLARARQLGDYLVVGINSDASVRMLGKAPNRPINALEDRAEVIAALRVVDFVIPFDETTPVELIRQLQPAVHVKGGDYDPNTMPETPVVESYGGRVVILPLLEGRSSTRIIDSVSASAD